MRRVAIALLGSALVLAAAGCGGSGGAKSSSQGYSLEPTKSCFEKAGLTTAVVKSQYLPGAGGNLRVQFTHKAVLLDPTKLSGTESPDEFVFLVFEKTPASATATENKAITLTIKSLRDDALSITRAAVKAGVQTSGNVFYYSPSGPLTKAERAKVESCLS
jgi:hypothetical protein